MATITTSQYLDNGTACTSGETWTMNSGAILTIRTDTRWHSNSPASMLGSLGTMTINEGGCLIDARNVRWLAYTGGSGNVPAIGTTISQGEVSGYLLGVWSALNSAPTAPATTMPDTGFLKFREVTGLFSAGALTGISASASGPDVTGWIEIAMDQLANIVISRLGFFRTRGNWFYLDNTNGLREQVIQTPFNGGTLSHPPGVWIETAPASDTYEFYPALNGATCGWSVDCIGVPEGLTDRRQKFVKMVPSGGGIQIGENAPQVSTYASLAAQAATYASLSESSSYIWENDIVTVYFSAGHIYETGDSVGMDFTSGGALAFDGIYQVTVIDAYFLTIHLTGSGIGGNVTMRGLVSVVFTAHALAIGNQVSCTFTSGSLNGNTTTYEIVSVPSISTWRFKYPHVAALTGGVVSCIHTLTMTFTAHRLTVGQRAYLEFSSGTGVNGVYLVRTTTANTYNVNFPHSSITSGNVTARFDLGYIPPSGCKVRIPNIITQQCTTAARSVNVLPHATVASRPQFITTTAGVIDLEFFYDTGWYEQFAQAFSVSLKNCAVNEGYDISECANIVNIDTVGVGASGLSATPLLCTSNFAGVNVSNSKFTRSTTNTTSNSMQFSVCSNVNISNVESGLNWSPKPTGNAFYFSQCANVQMTNCRSLNSPVRISTSNNVTVLGHDHVDRYVGFTSSVGGGYLFTVDTKSKGVFIDGVTFGFGGQLTSIHPYTGLLNYNTSNDIILRNAGTFDNPLQTGTWEPNLYAMSYISLGTGNSDNVKIQRVFVTNLKTAVTSLINSDKNIVFETLKNFKYFIQSSMAIIYQAVASLNCRMKGISGYNYTTGQASVYGHHFEDYFCNENLGRYVLVMNEATTETAWQFTMVSGVPKFNSSGGILMSTVGDQAIWEDAFFRLGHTGFWTGPAGFTGLFVVMAGGTIGNYTIEFQIDLGAGWNGTWNTLDVSNLSPLVIDPSIGFKMKIRVTTNIVNTTAITSIRIYTTTSTAAQRDNLYPLDVLNANLTISGIVSGSDVVFYIAGTSTVLLTRDAISGTTALYNYDTIRNVDVGVFKAGYVPAYIRNYTLTESNVTLPITQMVDRNYV